MAPNTRTTGRPMTSFDVGGERGDAFDVVGAVEEDKRPPADRFEAAFPAGLADGLEHLGPIERPPDPRQDLRGGDSDRRVSALVAAGQGGGEGIAAVGARIDEPVPAARHPGLEGPAPPEDLGHGGAAHPGDPPDLPKGFPPLTPQTTGTPGLMMPAFSKAIWRRVEPRCCWWSLAIVVMTETRGRTTLVASKRPPMPHFEDRDIDLALGELEKGEGSQDLEVGRVVGELPFGHEPVDHGLQPLEQRSRKRTGRIGAPSTRIRSSTRTKWGRCRAPFSAHAPAGSVRAWP